MDVNPDSDSTSRCYDIVIVGAGPAGLMLSTCLARWGYQIKHIDIRAEPTRAGRADGIQPRSLDLLRNMGLKSTIMSKKPARVYEVAFWDQLHNQGGITRTGTWASCPSFIDARYPFTTLLHQGYIEQAFIEDLSKHYVEIQRPWRITGFTSNEVENPDYPVKVNLEHVDGTAREVIHSKYLFGADGSRSFIRKQLKINMKHLDPIQFVWGVIDGVVKTNFPDIKMKCTIHSDHGSVMIIPREDDMVRLYIQISSSTDQDWNSRRTATQEEVQATAKRILQPYSIVWETVTWYSVYPIGQGIADNYTLDHRVILGGDACHTHSPKAGQGMNTAFHDAINLAWKIHAVEGGFCNRDILSTYEVERRGVAMSLLAFDNKYARLFSQRLQGPTSEQIEAVISNDGDYSGDNQFVKTFKESCEFTSGYGVRYEGNIINWHEKHQTKSPLINPEGINIQPGRLFINVDVTRVVDANIVHLEQEVPLNGSFRLYIFAGRPASTRIALSDFAHHLSDSKSFYSAYMRPDLEVISHLEKHNPHSLFFTLCTIFATVRSSIEIDRDVPDALGLYRDHIYADDRWDSQVAKVKAPAHAKVGIDEDRGGVVVVRPDGHVGITVSLVEGRGTVDVLNNYFGTFCTKTFGAMTGFI